MIKLTVVSNVGCMTLPRVVCMKDNPNRTITKGLHVLYELPFITSNTCYYNNLVLLVICTV